MLVPFPFGMQAAALHAVSELSATAELVGKPHPHPKPQPSEMETVFTDGLVNALVPISAIAGILFALWLWQRVSSIHVRGGAGVRSETGREYLLEEEQRGESEVRAPGFVGRLAPLRRFPVHVQASASCLAAAPSVPTRSIRARSPSRPPARLQALGFRSAAQSRPDELGLGRAAPPDKTPPAARRRSPRVLRRSRRRPPTCSRPFLREPTRSCSPSTSMSASSW